jgi:hypothetical protein
MPHSVSEKYYFARGPQQVNRVVDIGPVLQQKTACIRACRTMINHMVRDMNDVLAQRSLRLPAFARSDQAAADEFIKAAFVERDRRTGARHGLEYAEEFHYIGPDRSLDEYISRNAVPL